VSLENAPASNHESPLPVDLLGLILRLASERIMAAYMATHDIQTGLLNNAATKYAIDKRIAQEEELLRIGEPGEPLIVIALDLDKFKAINDELGHPEGDRLLEDLGPHLNTHFKRKGEIVGEKPGKAEQIDDTEADIGRMGGDEFIIVVNPGRKREDIVQERRIVPKSGELLDKAKVDARLIIDNFVAAQPKEIKYHLFNASMGGAEWKSGMTTKDLLKAADDDLYKDKKRRGHSRNDMGE